MKFVSKEDTVKWLGHDSIVEMEAYRATLQKQLCDMFGVHSYSTDLKGGRPLDGEKVTLANQEEDAILYVQRWLNRYRKIFNEDEGDYK